MAQLPSATDSWVSDIGLYDDDSDEPMQISCNENSTDTDQKVHIKGSTSKLDTLQLDLKKKSQETRDKLSQSIEDSDKLRLYTAGLDHYLQEQEIEDQIKKTKVTHETQLSEKQETIQTLLELVGKQDKTIVLLHSKLIGEASTDDNRELFTYDSVRKLTDQLRVAQQENSDLNALLIDLQTQMTKKANDGDIAQENRPMNVILSEMSGEANSDSSEYVRKLESENSSLRSSRSDLGKELADLKRKNLYLASTLRNRIKREEEKYSNTLATPPKVIVKSVISLENMDKIDELHSVRRDLQSQLAGLKVKTSLEANSLQETTKKLTEENGKLSADLNKTAAECQQKVGDLESRLQQMADNHAKMLRESTVREEQLTAEFTINIELAEKEAKRKYFKTSIKEMFNVAVSLKDEQQRIVADMMSMSSMIRPVMNDAQKSINLAIIELNDRSKVLAQRYHKEMKLRKKYHNELVEIKGNIRVFCRVRPVIEEDGIDVDADNIITFDNIDDSILTVEHRNYVKQFVFDRVFRPSSTQLEVFNEVESFVISCIDGFNVSMLAYGQTGSGKTFTMEGTLTDHGINKRALQRLFDEVADRSDWTYSLNVSMMEIYNESLRDLLSPDPLSCLDIRQSKEGVFIPGLSNYVVQNVNDVNKVFSVGQKNRSTASTNMNLHSSRSHAIFVINIVGTNSITGTRTYGKLNLVDLAGSERVSKSGAIGARMVEAQHINKSLSAFGDVIHALHEKRSHVPYRNSKLTYLLQDSLGGESKTLLLVQVAPVRKNGGETSCSLDFAQRVRNVELGQAARRIEAGKNEVKSKLKQ